MSRLALSALCLSLAVVGATPAAMASSLPIADFYQPKLGIGVGNGVSLGLDFPVSRSWDIGGSINSGFFVRQVSDLDLHALYKILPGGRNRLTLDLLLGVDAFGNGFFQGTSLNPFVGVALAYPFAPRFTGRLNVAISPFGLGDVNPSGLELGYRFSSNLEGTLGVNGRGDVLGLNVLF